MHAIVVDDEERLVELVCRYLEELGFATTRCYDGPQALAAVHEVDADVMALDLMMPGLNGLEVCRTLRREGIDIPILMLTARGTVAERVTGLEAGADDYLVKPFAIEELAARLRVLGRRRDVAVGRFVVGDLVVGLAEQRVWIGGDEVEVPRRQWAMLAELIANTGKVVSRQQLFDAIWDGEVDIRSNALEAHVSRLRLTLAEVEGVSITTVRGRGYRLDVTEPVDLESPPAQS